MSGTICPSLICINSLNNYTFYNFNKNKIYSKKIINKCLKDELLKRLINRKNLLTVDEKFVLKGQDVESEGGVMIGVW